MKIIDLGCDISEKENTVTINFKSIFGTRKTFVGEIDDIPSRVYGKANLFCLNIYNQSLSDYVVKKWDKYNELLKSFEEEDKKRKEVDNQLAEVEEKEYWNDFFDDIEPVVGLPEGWNWVKYDDGSGHLQGPNDENFFSYDLTTNEGKDINGVWQFFDDFDNWREGCIKKIKRALNDGLPKKYVCPKTIFETNESAMLCNYDFKVICKNLENNAFENSNEKLTFVSGTDVIDIKAYTYEPDYECFDTTHSIYLNGKLLWGKQSRNIGPYCNEEYTIGEFKDDDEIKAINYLQNYFNGKALERTN